MDEYIEEDKTVYDDEFDTEKEFEKALYDDTPVEEEEEGDSYEKCFEEETKKEVEDDLRPMTDEDYELDEVVGARDKKPVMSVLNKTKISKIEMDELFINE